jgi:hypothetical protein
MSRQDKGASVPDQALAVPVEPLGLARSGFDPSREIVQLNAGDVELKDCPFCGSPAFWQEACATYWVACTICLSNGQAMDTLDEAVSAWNARAVVAARI